MLKQTLRYAVACCTLLALTAGPLHAQDTTSVPPDSMGMDQDSMMTASPDTAMGMPSMQTVVEIIEQEPELSTLAEALQQAGLVEALSGSGPFTILAPSNDAFEQLSDELRQLIQPAGASDTTGALGEMDSTMVEATPTDSMGQTGGAQQEADLLVALLRRHVIVDEVTTADTAEITQAVTLLGDTLRISVEGGAIMFEDATAEQADLEASNGVVHIIDAVLVPAQGAQQLLELDSQREQASEAPSDTTGMMEIPDTTGMMGIPDSTEMMDMEADTSSADTTGILNR